MMSILKFLFAAVLLISVSYPQGQHTFMTYNLLNYPGSDAATRNPYFRTTIASVVPDVLVVQEMTSQAGVDGFLNNVLNVASSGYAAGSFFDGPDTDNAIFYKSAAFTFLANNRIPTSLRDINEFVLRENASGDTIRIYSLHLKASTGFEQQRAAEVDSLRKRTNTLPSGSNYIVVGDYNIYGSTESAYQKLLNQNGQGYFLDLYTLTGIWNQAQYSAYHTQSSRGGSSGGMDDRFDMILMSPAVINSGGVTYVPGSYTAYGNDGNHYNDSINAPPNLAVGQTIANALHYGSDHLPVIANFTFESTNVQLLTLKALIEGFYQGSAMIPDTVIVQLRSITSPYTLVDQTKILLNSTGTGSGNFSNVVNGTPYYLVVKHRNGIETWSATGQTFIGGALTYDFTTAADKAYGNNLKLINGKWCIFGGDVNQDGFVNATDLNLVFTNNIIGSIGYISTDLNEDMFTEIGDLTIVFMNSILSIQRKLP